MRQELAQRFVEAAHTAAKLNHPNIAAIYSSGIYDGRAVIVMELIEGDGLDDLLKSGSLSPQAALEVLDQLFDAIEYIHEKGIVHRDIKPENIFINRAGQVKLPRIGITHTEDIATRATTPGTALLGTLGYLSPEEVRGKPADVRSNMFSIAAIAYEMFTGRNPFGESDGIDSTALLYRIVHEPAPDLPMSADAELPYGLRPAIMTALSKNPSARPQAAREFKKMLYNG